LLIGESTALSTKTGHRLANVVAALVLLQFALGAYNPLRYIPTQAMRSSGDHFIETIAATEGEVLVLMHPYYAVLAGKTPSAQIAALWHARQRGTLPLPPDFVSRLEKQRYSAIISDETIFETDPALQALLNRTYRKSEFTNLRIYDTELAPATTTGMIVQPQIIYRPIDR
jgi:hypothetical protein